jgi:hypothetical protein
MRLRDINKDVGHQDFFRPDRMCFSWILPHRCAALALLPEKRLKVVSQ